MITVEKYSNFLGIGDAKRESEAADRELKSQRLDILAEIANKPAGETNKLLIILPIAVVLIGGIVAVVLIKKKRGK